MIKNDRNFWMYLLLTIITCGIYGIVFFWYVCQDLNTLGNGDGQESPNYIVVMLLGIITCGIYTFYWYYKQGNRLQTIIQRYGANTNENGTTYLLWILLGSFIGIGPFVAQYLFIKNLNTAANLYNGQMA